MRTQGRVLGVVAGLAVFAAVGGAVACETCGCKAAKACPAVKAQTTCPVMGGKINTNLFVDVKGVRIYVCCSACVAKVKADPDAYIAKIKTKGETPQSLAPGVCPKCGSDQKCETCRKAECEPKCPLSGK
jgi:hypothetical protein